MELSPFSLEYSELFALEDRVSVLCAPSGNSNYDLRFDSFFACRRLCPPSEERLVVARLGAIPNYDLVYAQLQEEGINLIHSFEEHLRASELPYWYPLIFDLTPVSIWRSDPLSWQEASSRFGVPFFMKGTRQTSGHQKALSIIDNAEQYGKAVVAYSHDSILRYQGLVYRKYVPLRLVDDGLSHRIPSSFEFRTFWWKGALAGCGQYWWDGRRYTMTEPESIAGISIAAEATKRLRVPFLVVDIAQTVEHEWIIIECNDGQESGYCGVAPIALWQRILDLERLQS